MRILGIESTCDETGIGIVQDGRRVLANVVSSSAKLHQKYAGIVPEVAAREQVKVIIPAISEVLIGAFGKVDVGKFEALAVTSGPGLIGSLLVGVETAKALAWVWRKPLVPVNHLIGHLYANWLTLTSNLPTFPLIGLIVSGGHTDLIRMTGHGQSQWLGGTRDDAAGEVFDKVAKILGLGFPGGPGIERTASNFKSKNSGFKLPRPMLTIGNFDFSFSGLKTAAVNLVQGSQFTAQQIPEIAYAFQEAVVDILITKTLRAAEKFAAKSIVVGGGVAANQLLRSRLTIGGSKLGIDVKFPPVALCIDNGAMIATAAFYNFQPKPPEKIQADSSLHF